jgi:hypothetical protein
MLHCIAACSLSRCCLLLGAGLCGVAVPIEACSAPHGVPAIWNFLVLFGCQDLFGCHDLRGQGSHSGRWACCYESLQNRRECVLSCQRSWILPASCLPLQKSSFCVDLMSCLCFGLPVPWSIWPCWQRSSKNSCVQHFQTCTLM